MAKGDWGQWAGTSKGCMILKHLDKGKVNKILLEIGVYNITRLILKVVQTKEK